jgi:hypothetical protein
VRRRKDEKLLLDATTTATTDEVGSGTREDVLFDREHLDDIYQPSDSVSNIHGHARRSVWVSQ